MTMTLIETKTLGSSAAAIEFVSIPQTFTDLVIAVSARDTGNGESWLRFNGDSGTNYSWRRLRGDGSSVGSDSQASYGGYNTFFYFAHGSNPSARTANTFASGSIVIPNYTAAVAKSISGDAVEENNATTSFQAIYAGLWNSTAAITSISFDLQSSDYVAGTTISLYGVLKGSDGTTVVS